MGAEHRRADQREEEHAAEPENRGEDVDRDAGVVREENSML
jgi:hypothetical protein